MALIKCPECGKEISDQAPACIHCGFPLRDTSKGGSSYSKVNNRSKIFSRVYTLVLIIITCIVEYLSDINMSPLAIVVPILVFEVFAEENNSWFPLKVQRLNPWWIFLFYSSLGTIPVILCTHLGTLYRPHHILTNCIIVPGIITLMILHLRNLDRRYNALETVYEDESSKNIVINIAKTTVLLVVLYANAFMNVYEIFDTESWVRNLNTLFLAASMYGFVMSTTVWLLSMGKLKENKNWIEIKAEITEDIYPKDAHIAVIFFYVAWGFMAFYDTDHRIELVYYLTAGLFIVISFVITRITLKPLISPENHNRLLMYLFGTYAVLTGYILLVAVLEFTGFSAAKQSVVVKDNSLAMILAFVMFFVICIIVILQKNIQTRSNKVS